MNRLFYLFIGLLGWMSLSAQSGYQIDVQIDGFEQQEIYLGHYLMDKQYLSDTAYLENGHFVFQGEEPLNPGMYLVVMPPENRFFQVLINEGEQNFSMHVKDVNEVTNGLKIEGSPDNQLFYDYLAYLRDQRPEADALRQQISETKDAKKLEKLNERMDKLNLDVRTYQDDLITNHPKSITAAIIRVNLPLEQPDYNNLDSLERQKAVWYYNKQHYFDAIDLGDPRMVRTPFLFQRVDGYLQKMTYQHPDSLAESLGIFLDLMKPSEETFKYYLVHYLNEYAGSKIVGFDAVYVALVERYYMTGQATWTEEEQLEKIIDNAKRLKPLLIGKTAPNIEMETQGKEKIWLHDFESPYTVLFFWDPGCGHCKKSMPDMVKFYEAYKDRGVEVFAVCTKLYNELDECWDYIDEKGIGIWLNTVDPYHRSRYKTIYDIRSTPQVYILDHKKEILSKRVGAEQLPEVMEKILERFGEPEEELRR
ncbi:MAG: redoxin domain-containing protein [Bacteroidota bacterium]